MDASKGLQAVPLHLRMHAYRLRTLQLYLSLGQLQDRSTFATGRAALADYGPRRGLLRLVGGVAGGRHLGIAKADRFDWSGIIVGDFKLR